MKLKEEYSEFQKLYNDGYRFNPIEHIFYVANKNKFTLPVGYESWTVEKYEPGDYLKERLKELGIEKSNKIELIDQDNSRFESPIFTHNKFGDIEILQYSLKRIPHTYEKNKTSAGTKFEYNVQKRLHPLYADFCQGKYDGGEIINKPHWHPRLIEAFENKEEIETLVITEGPIKGFKATNDGILTVAINSISHFRDKKTNFLHPEIIEFLHVCNVKNCVILWDGDCRNISSKALEKGEDLSKRPNDFYNFAHSIKKLLQKVFNSKRLQIFFATIKTDEIPTEPKGIDDLLLVKNIKSKDIIADFNKIGQLPGYYIDWINITNEAGVKNMRQYFNLTYVGDFYNYHIDLIKGQNFVFNNTTYRVEKGQPLVEVSKDLKKYMRIGSDYFRMIEQGTYNEDGEKIREDEMLVPWSVTEIGRDFGKENVSKVARYDGFCNVANHVNYKQVMDNKWNLYSDIKHDIVQGDWSNIDQFIRHIFQEQYEMALDYIQILYTKPYQKLPVLCLVSKEEGTGKSTFLKLLYMIFQNNMTFVSPDDIMGQWTSHWVSKLIVACEETFFEKKEAEEKIKNYSTADKIMRSERFVNNSLIDCFLKFVFCSNHEDNFIKLNKGASRFWVVKVGVIQGKSNPDFEKLLQDEVSAFLHFIQSRELSTVKRDRMWFHPDQFKNDAFQNIVNHSEPGIVKNLRIALDEYFLKFATSQLIIDSKNLRDYFGVKADDFYIKEIVKEYFGVTKEHGVQRFKFHINEKDFIHGTGRVFIFNNTLTTEQKEEQKEISFEEIEETDKETTDDEIPF